MTGKQKIWLAIAAGHLMLATYNAFTLPPPSERHAAGWPIRWYAAMSGANNSYGFFKMVGNTCRVSFIMEDADGKTWTDVLSTADNHEANLRFDGSPFMIGDFGDDLVVRWAAAMFGRHATAQRVDVIFEQFDPTNMPEHRAGERPEWRLTDSRVFFRREQQKKSKAGNAP